jgi:hypothetical protein
MLFQDLVDLAGPGAVMVLPTLVIKALEAFEFNLELLEGLRIHFPLPSLPLGSDGCASVL